MTTTEARTLAQSDPVPNLTKRWGEIVAQAQREVEQLVTTLSRVDGVCEQLQAYGVTVSVDLGAVGNQAAAARRDLEKQRDTPTFELPR